VDSARRLALSTSTKASTRDNCRCQRECRKRTARRPSRRARRRIVVIARHAHQVAIDTIDTGEAWPVPGRCPRLLKSAIRKAQRLAIGSDAIGATIHRRSECSTRDGDQLIEITVGIVIFRSSHTSHRQSRRRRHRRLPLFSIRGKRRTAVGEATSRAALFVCIQQLPCSIDARFMRCRCRTEGVRRWACPPLGGLPLYKSGTPVGGVGVIADGLYGLDLNSRYRNP